MKKTLLLLLAFVFASVYTASGQRSDWPKVYSDEFHFIASFPDQPKTSEGDIEMSFGKGFSHRWTLERPGALYEVSVTNFPDLSVKMDDKSINEFYKVVCKDLAIQYGDILCKNHMGLDQFAERGRFVSYGTKRGSVSILIYLARQRLYLAKVVMNASVDDKEAQQDIKKFLDDFLFMHKDENEKKWSWGLPASESQGLRYN